MEKQLLVCPNCENSKNEVYAQINDNLEYERIFVRCPNCGKESLVAYLDGKSE